MLNPLAILQMALPGRKVVANRRSRPERCRERKGLELEELEITKRTRILYYHGAQRLLPLLEKATSENDFDDRVSEWIQQRWRKGSALFTVNAALCGVQHFLPWCKRRLNRSWKMFKTWRRVEIPVRSPPIPKQFLYCMANYAISRHDVLFAGLLVLGFEALLRTGELLRVRPHDVLLRQGQCLVHLAQTKTTAKRGAPEVVPFRKPWAYTLLQTVQEIAKSEQGNLVPIWNRSHQAFRKKFRKYLRYFKLHRFGFQPYSLRRGGATEVFRETGSYDLALDAGRWQSTKVAKVYIQEGLSRLPHLVLPMRDQALLDKWDPFNSSFTPS